MVNNILIIQYNMWISGVRDACFSQSGNDNGLVTCPAVL